MGNTLAVSDACSVSALIDFNTYLKQILGDSLTEMSGLRP